MMGYVSGCLQADIHRSLGTAIVILPANSRLAEIYFGLA